MDQDIDEGVYGLYRGIKGLKIAGLGLEKDR